MTRQTSRFRTAFRAVALPALIALIAAGCGDDDSGGDEGATEITVWAMGAEGEALQAFAEEFMAENPDITVNVDPLAWDVAHDKLITSVAGGEGPDVSQMGTTWMGEFASIGALAPVPDDIDLNLFFEGARDTAIVDDTAYGVPWYVETRVLYYRTDIAEAAGITEPPGTWDELKVMAQAMQQQGGAEWGIGLSPNNWQELLPFVWQQGGELLTEDGQANFDSPEMVEAIEFYQSFFDEGLTPPSQAEGFDITPAFVAGTHPMFFSGPWHMSLIEELGGAELEGKWTVAPMPVEDSGTSFVGGSNLVVFETSDNQDEAWEFISWLTTPGVQAGWYETVSALPSVVAAWEEGTLASDESLATFGDQLEDAQSPPPIPAWEEIASEINTQLELATTGGAGADEAAQNIQAKAESVGVE